MGERKKTAFWQAIQQTSPSILRNPKVTELLKIYRDLERTLLKLKRNMESVVPHGPPLTSINIHKLIHQLSRSKKKLERKIHNKLLLEKQTFTRKLRDMTNSLRRH